MWWLTLSEETEQLALREGRRASAVLPLPCHGAALSEVELSWALLSAEDGGCLCHSEAAELQEAHPSSGCPHLLHALLGLKTTAGLRVFS